ncbi:cysteine desulfurase family protein [Oscillibacter sp.]|uniref:cysteine desulfurase family protein n=1 Tax=Oscillibacter sp. TaxID=1945593 RepID=UPI00258A430C|nr:cysteine desulfurase family protein [Oscillibacter sp.]
MIYMDHAATTQMTPAVIQAMLLCMEDVWYNPSSLYMPAQRAAEMLRNARSHIAACINASPEEIIFTSGGSEADNQAILSAAQAGSKAGKRHIVSTAIEHHAVLHTLEKLEQEGYAVELLDVHSNGIVSAAQVERAIRKDTCLVTVMYANNEIGSIQPISEIGAVCREKGVIFHTDAVQAAGHLPIDVKAQNIDFLSLSAHKFHGPKGIGVLYARSGIPVTSVIKGGDQERGQRAGTENVPAVVGMAAALEESCSHMAEDTRKLTILRDQLIAGLSQIPHSVLNGDLKNRLPGNVNFSFEGVEGESLVLLLDQRGICASTGSACTSQSLSPSHVLLAIGRSDEMAASALRLSLDMDNTQADVDEVLRTVPELVKELRGKRTVKVWGNK